MRGLGREWRQNSKACICILTPILHYLLSWGRSGKWGRKGRERENILQRGTHIKLFEMQEFGSEVAILYFRGFNSATFFVVVVAAVVVFVVTSTGLAVCISATIFVVDVVVVVASTRHFRQHFRHHFCCQYWTFAAGKVFQGDNTLEGLYSRHGGLD